MTLSENASRNGYRYFHHRLGVFEALQTNKGIRVVAGCYESPFIVLADEIKTSGVNVSKDLMGLFSVQAPYTWTQDWSAQRRVFFLMRQGAAP